MTNLSYLHNVTYFETLQSLIGIKISVMLLTNTEYATGL